MGYALVDYRRAFCLYLAYQVFWLSSLSVVSIGGKSLAVSLLMGAYFIFLYALPRVGGFAQRKMNYPLLIPLTASILSLTVTCLFSLKGFSGEATRTVSTLIGATLIIWLSWRVLETEEDFKFLFTVVTIVMLVACVYGIAEYVTRSNPFFVEKQHLAAAAGGEINAYDMSGPRGYRLTSLFEHPIGAGMTMGLYCAFVLVLYARAKAPMPLQKLAIAVVLLCIPCVVLTKMRSPLVFMVIAALPVVSFRNNNSIKVMFAAVIAAVIAVIFLQQAGLYDIFASLFDVDKLVSGQGVYGSSFTQRVGQFDVIYDLMMMSPVGGLGTDFDKALPESMTAGALAYESIWFEQMAGYGALGIIATVMLIVYTVIVIPVRYRSREAFFLAAALWVTYTFTSIPSFRMVLFYAAYFYFIKSSDAYREGVTERKGLTHRVLV